VSAGRLSFLLIHLGLADPHRISLDVDPGETVIETAHIAGVRPQSVSVKCPGNKIPDWRGDPILLACPRSTLNIYPFYKGVDGVPRFDLGVVELVGGGEKFGVVGMEHLGHPNLADFGFHAYSSSN
jgi:hypothetical protein